MAKVKKTQKIVVAMSGGVDSSVAAALLKRGACLELGRRVDVVGVHMKFWSDGKKSGNRCCTPEAEKRARMVAKKLGIPFYVFNFEKEFKKRIVDYFLKEEKAGRTPNPCVVCNKEIKFGLLLEKALKLGAEYIATGHYAKLVVGSEVVSRKSKLQTTNYKLLTARDTSKDQSYFLWQLNQKQLKHILFPVGGYTKTEVRSLAKKFKLPVAKTPESMEICFVRTTINDFLKKHLATRPGLVVNKSGKILGRHQGLWFYTIGQRKGIGIASEKPYYVLRKDVGKNELVVTQNEKDLLQKELIAKDVNWLSEEKPKLPIRVSAKIRYRSPSAPAIVRQKKGGKGKNKKDEIEIIFSKPQRAITPGQSVVFYAGGELLGGGVIK